MKNILVTGGAGYVGAVLVPKLLDLGYQVRVLDLFLYDTPEAMLERNPKGLEVVKGDLRDPEVVDRSIAGIDCIIHLAGISNDPSSDLDPTLTVKVNVDGTIAMIEKAKAAGIKRFINASSSSVYGIKEEPDVTEELKLEPLTVYSESKVAIEDYLRDKRGDMVAVSVRSATVCGYSPRMRLDLTVNILTHHAIKKGKITVFGGTQKRPNIHIEDITDLYAELIKTPAELIDGKEFNACGANHTVMEIAEMVQSQLGDNTPITKEDTNDLRSYHISAEKIKKELGFAPKRSLSQAVGDVAAALRDGRISNPEAEIHYNVKTMKQVLGQ